ncbi:cytochrome c-type biogenesis protein CcmH [Lentibacter sp. XHP0401]|jgi:cytochrome c-type biogenesis protein CcmH|uniref:cytochrome c-type biogenesis protein n=1 Tax=Lentibacter sp. XHP0401 TaxID=2984334 RepID=UPI0021E7309E|nr:cytochrome c-type biogenesis protein [Lentibacter sp. XHP0401]MCV2892281.1 cytochrome c-type biogenesis protein CcmH [Lentibacter sp. XHP0401]
MRWFLLALALWAAPALAVQPNEVLSDPVLEERARALSQELRCLVCRNENIDDSNAELARDLRLLVRERLVEGDSDEEVLSFIVSRYGEYVLLNPTKGGSNMILYYAGPAMLLFALLIGGFYLRTRARSTPEGSNTLNEEEAERLKRIMRD